MIAHGDEFGRTQQGNNNVYCQDNELAWVDWTLDADQESLLDFTRHVMRLRAEHPVFRRRRFFAGSADHGGESDLGDIAWFEPDGEHMDEEAWANGYAKSLMVFLNGRAIRETDSRGGAIRDDSFLVLFNAHYEPIDFVIPEASYGRKWFVEINTAGDVEDAKPTVASVAATSGVLVPGATVTVQARSIIVVGCPLDDEA